MRAEHKDVIVRAKFGKGRKSKIREWRFSTRKRATLFAKVFLRYNPKCRNYIVIGGLDFYDNRRDV